MSKTQPREAADPGFEVDIKSGGRAYDSAARPAPALSPARAAARSQARRRTLLIATTAALVLALIALWAWLSNPATGIPSDAVARVNGEFIYERDIAREIDLTRVSKELSDSPEVEVRSPASVLEDLINRKMQVLDARKAGVTATQQELDAALGSILNNTGLTRQQIEDAFARYNLTLDDLRAVAADTYVISKHIRDNINMGASTDEERRNRENNWKAGLAQTSKIERFKPAGAGPAPRVGSEAPDFTLKDLGGKEVTLSDLRGRPVMINFWATWCPPCRAEIPTLRDMYNETNKDRTFEILGVATQSDRQTIEAFVQEFKMPFPVLPDVGNRVTSLYRILPIPTSVFIDKDGIIRYIQIGIADRPLLEKWLLGR